MIGCSCEIICLKQQLIGGYIDISNRPKILQKIYSAMENELSERKNNDNSMNFLIDKVLGILLFVYNKFENHGHIIQNKLKFLTSFVPFEMNISMSNKCDIVIGANGNGSTSARGTSSIVAPTFGRNASVRTPLS